MARESSYNDPRDETEADRLRGILVPGAVSLDLVSALAGDRAMTELEDASVRELRTKRGSVFFSDLLYAVSHHYFAPEIAEMLWDEILEHKLKMSRLLGRNVRISVAVLDYLSNVTGKISSPTLISEAYVAKIANLSVRDGMTGLFNHTTCYELLELELKAYKRYGVVASVILLDIDDFKRVNDRWGHQEGDRILVELAAILTQQTRDSDICCRFGGEEFVVILPFTECHEAAEIAERIRKGASRIGIAGQTLALSAGVASCDDAASTPHALISRADDALGQAKKSGKNQVVVIR
jgi:diguanylate cyclase (GGDEF)-like protein